MQNRPAHESVTDGKYNIYSAGEPIDFVIGHNVATSGAPWCSNMGSSVSSLPETIDITLARSNLYGIFNYGCPFSYHFWYLPFSCMTIVTLLCCLTFASTFHRIFLRYANKQQKSKNKRTTRFSSVGQDTDRQGIANLA
jgi:hypothetical protein